MDDSAGKPPGEEKAGVNLASDDTQWYAYSLTRGIILRYNIGYDMGVIPFTIG